MEEDIDIEEHDLLDDPRIKSIFPDLSRVKIEVPDDEDMEEQNAAPVDERRLRYQYDYNCITESADNSMDDHSEYNEEHHHNAIQFDGEQIHNDLSNCEMTGTDDFPSNSMIFGSKPSYEELYVEALNSEAMVCLEDWGMRLDSNPCYCNICQTLFPTVNAHDAHKMVSHSYLVAVVNTARKSTGKQSESIPHRRQCNHCNLVFEDDTALIRHLYELLPVSDLDTSVANKNHQDSVANVQSDRVKDPAKAPKFNVALKKKINYSNPKSRSNFYYKCNSCNELLTSYYQASIHRKLRHPTLSRSRLYIKYNREITKRKIPTGHYRSIRGKVTELTLVPKSALFQCGKCSVHYLSAFSALQHYKMCIRGSSTMLEKCSVCHRKIVKRDILKHKKQHDVTEKFKVFSLSTKPLYERILCKCPKCFVCFDEMSFWKHSKACVDVDYVRCGVCDQNVYNYVYKIHEFRHHRKNYGRKDFIVLEYFDPKAKIVATKVKDEGVNKVGPKLSAVREPAKVTSARKINLFYCPHCTCCQMVTSTKCHLDLSCKTWPMQRKRFCDKCGLVFSVSGYFRHKLIHGTRNIDFSDFVFYNLITGSSIKPPINNFYTCKFCHIQFIRYDSLKSHKCNTDYKICDICNKKYHLKTYPIHRKFHTNNKNNKEIMPKLLQQYNSMSSTWNVIFMCKDCCIVNASYDMAVEHSQRHITEMPNDYVHCKVCNMSIEKSYVTAHKNLHSSNPKLNRDSFKILKYNYGNLFKDNWMVFTGLSDRDVKLIISKSVYKDTRQVKMNVHGDSDDIKYYCNNCRTAVDDVEAHINSKCTMSPRYSCSYCKIKIDNLNGLVEHENRHENNRRTYKIVTFNDSKDKKYNLKLKTYAAVGSVNRVINKPAENKNKKYKLYCCRKCSVCVNTVGGVCYHTKCIPRKNLRLCNICDCNFSYQNFEKHKINHMRFPNLSKKTLMVVYFGGGNVKAAVKTEAKANTDTDNTVNTATIYKCGCGLHFTSVYTVKTHLKWPCDKKTWSKATCSKCKLIFPTDILVSHLCKHHSNNSTKLVIKNVVTRNLYQCCECKVIFSYKSDVEMHDCDKKYGMKCKICGNVYAKTCFRKHSCTETPDKIYIDRVNRTQRTKQIMLYRCETCDIHFTNLKAFKTHTKTSHKFGRRPTKCKICGLLFTSFSFQQHMVVHKSDVYTIKVLLSGSGEIIDLKGKNVETKNTRVRMSVRYTDGDSADGAAMTGDVNVDAKTTADDNETLNHRIKDKIGDSRYNNRLFKCAECGQHYLLHKSLIYHLLNHKDDTKQFPCELCGINFSKRTLPRHKYIHHEIMGLGAKDFEINTYDMKGDPISDKDVTEDKNNDTVSEINDNASNVSQVTLNDNDSIISEITDNDQVKDVSDVIDIDNDNNVIKDNENDNNASTVIVSNNDVSAVTDNENDASEARVSESDGSKVTVNENDINRVTDNDGIVRDEAVVSETVRNKIRYFKCSECNVCFVRQNECIKHVESHCLIDPKQYICCKLCNFQFMIGSLKFHMETHHDNDFKLDNVLIEEYSQVGDDLGTKIDVYYAADRVQSRLVSTTTDDEKA